MGDAAPVRWAEREQELLRALDEAAIQRARIGPQNLVLERITTGAPLARWGGDEFVLVRENVSGPGDTDELVQRIQKALRTPAEGDPEEREFAASIGVALSAGEGEDTPASLLQDADRAMYRAKGPPRDG